MYEPVYRIKEGYNQCVLLVISTTSNMHGTNVKTRYIILLFYNTWIFHEVVCGVLPMWIIAKHRCCLSICHTYCIQIHSFQFVTFHKIRKSVQLLLFKPVFMEGVFIFLSRLAPLSFFHTNTCTVNNAKDSGFVGCDTVLVCEWLLTCPSQHWEPLTPTTNCQISEYWMLSSTTVSTPNIT
jgi:hypothetical protein